MTQVRSLRKRETTRL